MSVENLATVQSLNSITPATIVAANTISPITRLTTITGTTPIQNIIPPHNGYHELLFITHDDYIGAAAFIPGGNINLVEAITCGVDCMILAVYDPRTKKYHIPNFAITIAG